MRVKIQQFLFGKNHSWAVCGKEIGRALLARGHDVEFVSTDGVLDKYIPDDLREHIVEAPKGSYDMQLSYTAMINFPQYLSSGEKNRFGIWNYEFTKIPVGHAKYYKFTDKFLPSSTFFHDICVANGVPADHMKMVPHAVDTVRFANAEPMELKTDRKRKLLVNIAQPHVRKNLRGTLDAFGRAFTKKDDVCLVMKVVDKKPDKEFEVSFSREFSLFKSRYKNHAQVLIYRDYITDIERLYKSCDMLFMLPSAEAFFFPALEMLASGGMVLTSRYGGQLDFLDDTNSLLVGGRMIRAPRQAQYWSSSIQSEMFEPDVDEAAEKLQHAVNNYDELMDGFRPNIRPQLDRLTWDHVADQIVQLCE